MYKYAEEENVMTEVDKVEKNIRMCKRQLPLWLAPIILEGVKNGIAGTTSMRVLSMSYSESEMDNMVDLAQEIAEELYNGVDPTEYHKELGIL